MAADRWGLHCLVQNWLAKPMGRCFLSLGSVLQRTDHFVDHCVCGDRKRHVQFLVVETACVDGSGDLHDLFGALADVLDLGVVTT